VSLKTFILTTHCDDRPGITAGLTGAIFHSGGNILDAQQFNDALTSRFFSRTLFSIESAGEVRLREALASVITEFNMGWKLRDERWRPKVILMVSKFGHCLGELLHRWRAEELKMDVIAVVSNHPKNVYRDMPDLADLAYYHFPVTPDTKRQQEAQLWELFQKSSANLVVLARYMQILSDDLAAKLSGRCINIHHSFLPSFKGANPYSQAHARGVKLIGATAHYVSADLDEGPIIEQDIQRIGHHDTPDDLTRKGREVERMVLARAVRYHIDDRVFLNGHRTIVFPD
jgi:formyltetrahydrofolate deformylase